MPLSLAQLKQIVNRAIWKNKASAVQKFNKQVKYFYYSQVLVQIHTSIFLLFVFRIYRNPP